MRRFVLSEISGEHVVRLRFLDEAEALPFELHIFPAERDTGSFLTLGRLKFAFSAKRQLNSAIETMARNVARIIEKNTAPLSKEDFASLFEKSKGFTALSGDSPDEKRIEILVGSDCPSDCIFCSDKPKVKGQKNQQAAYRALEQAKDEGYRAIEFGGLEPTSRADLPKLIAFAKSLGFTNLQLITNGSATAEMDYIKSLYEAGLCVLIVSIHAADKALETKITRTPGLFDKKRQSLENARKLLGDRETQRKKGRYFRTNTVMVRQNLDSLVTLADWLEAMQVSLIPLHYPWANGRALEHFKELVPTYSEVAKALSPLQERIADALSPVTVANLPHCVGLTFTGEQKARKATAGVRSMAGLSDSGEMTPSLPLDPSLTYAPICEKCADRNRCPGISLKYLQTYGEEGLHPKIKGKDA